MSAMTTDLTSQEIEILQLLADGKRLKEVADEMNLKERTIKIYVSRLHAKMECRTTANAVATALRQGVID
jgi:DNA-binding NarL/FixJ family response regulator